MINNTVDNFTGGIKCFSVDNENYGCYKCTWLKWWFKWRGDRHGFPDIHPSVYEKYQHDHALFMSTFAKGISLGSTINSLSTDYKQ